jgi:hypothetical protein
MSTVIPANADAIPLGNLVELAVEFENAAKELEDPTEVSCSILLPTAKRQMPTPIRRSRGIYYAVVEGNLPGKWRARFAGTGALTAAVEGVFWIANSDLA